MLFALGLKSCYPSCCSAQLTFALGLKPDADAMARPPATDITVATPAARLPCAVPATDLARIRRLGSRTRRSCSLLHTRRQPNAGGRNLYACQSHATCHRFAYSAACALIALRRFLCSTSSPAAAQRFPISRFLPLQAPSLPAASLCPMSAQSSRDSSHSPALANGLSKSNLMTALAFFYGRTAPTPVCSSPTTSFTPCKRAAALSTCRRS